MQIVGKHKIDSFMQTHAASRKALRGWITSTECASWKTPQDIKNQHRSVDFLASNTAIFNINGNRFRLVVQVKFERGAVLVEWVGTHAEYSKLNF